jgi:hypothetical protein
MLDKRGAILETARTISQLMRQNDINGAIIGGVAVVLHGHVRTTKDVDVLAESPLEAFRPMLEDAGASFSAENREFVLDGVPIHLVSQEMAKPAPKRKVVIEDITTVSLADLINLKLRSGISSIARAQDIADVIGLIKHHRLGGAFVPRVDKSLRADFRKLIKAVAE